MILHTKFSEAGRFPYVVRIMAIKEIIPRESKGDDTQFECHMGTEIWIVSLHFDAALIASKRSGCVYFSKGGEHDIGWGVRITHEENRRHWQPVNDPALIDLLDSLHFACLRKDETESAAPQSRRTKVEGELPIDASDEVEPPRRDRAK